MPAILVLAALALAAVALSLVWAWLLPLVLVGLATEIAAVDYATRVPAGVAVLYSAGLLVLCELVAWAESLRGHALVEHALIARRSASLGGLAAVGAAAAGVTFAAGSVGAPSTFVAGLLGAAAVVGIAMLVWTLGRPTTADDAG